MSQIVPVAPGPLAPPGPRPPVAVYLAQVTPASRITLGLITAALIMGSATLLNVRAGWMVAGFPVFALVGFLLAAGLGIYLVVKIILVDKY